MKVSVCNRDFFEATDKYSLMMIFTEVRHFRH